MNDLGLDRARLAPAGPPPQASRWEPTLWAVDHGGWKLLVKDIRHTNPVYRYTLGRWLLGREARIYLRLREFPFVPRCHGRLDKDGLLLERLDAVSLTRFPEESLPPAFFDLLTGQVEALHRRYIAHLDLRHRSNILVDQRGEPRLIDFASSISLEERPLRRWLFWPLLAATDRSGLIKWRLRYFPDQVPEADRRWYARLQRWRWLWPWKRLFGQRKARRLPATP